MTIIDRSALSGDAGVTAFVAPTTPWAVELDRYASRQVGTYERFIKGVVDRIGGLFLLLVTLPVIITMLTLARASLGPGVVFQQRRVGRNGKIFTVYKIRTMRPDRRVARQSFAEGERRVTHKHPDDPRLTPLGRFLRKWSFDELLQLWNVVRGEMSLVGPRPELVQIVEGYERWQHRRHEVKPGLTGLWQVSARGTGPMHERVDLDVEYVDRLSLWTDCKILVQTLPAVLGRCQGC